MATKAKSVYLYGNQLKILYRDGTSELALPTVNSSMWIVSGSGGVIPPDPTDDVFKWPFPRSTWNFTSYYGHSGIDRPGGSGDTVKAIGKGTVIQTWEYSGNVYPDFSEPYWRGNAVLIDHGTIDGHNISSLYCHMLETPLVSSGTTITGGQAIGKVGNTGASNGAHLHMEVIYDGARIPSSAPGQTDVGLGFTRTLNWMDAHTDGSSW